jgi:hypothetical protein
MVDFRGGKLTLELWRLRASETNLKAKVTPQAQSTSIKARVAIRYQRFVRQVLVQQILDSEKYRQIFLAVAWLR